MSSIFPHNFGQTVVCQSDMSISVNYDILWFQISIQYIVSVKMSNRCQSLQKVEFGFVLFHTSDLSQEIEQFSPVAVLHAKYEEVGSFEAKVELSDEGVSDTLF